MAGRKDGDVVALVGPARLLGVLAMVPAFPQAREAPGLAVREYGGAVDDARLRRVGERNLDDVDAEQGGANVARDVADAAFQLVLLTHRRRARKVNDDRIPGLGSGHHRVRVRAAAGLDLADLDRPRRPADVEEAPAPRT